MDVVERIAQRQQTVLDPHSVGQRFADMVPHHRPEVADDRVDAFGAEDARKPLGRGVNALQTAFGLAGKGFLDGFDFGMYHRQFALEEGWAAENQVFAPHFDPFFDPFDSLEPDQFGHAAAVVGKRLDLQSYDLVFLKRHSCSL